MKAKDDTHAEGKAQKHNSRLSITTITILQIKANFRKNNYSYFYENFNVHKFTQKLLVV